ncbi:hypothetical protein DL95DRAFT_456251 [Leptodontidium sp. 2 PMI_412]|nr:hypothetical protein DL95DRAFT_456251 [Leptodontidium sp. 2 PMI_412]
MDPVSTTLSVIPLVLQLGKGLNKLSSLLKSIQEAPSEIEWIIEELDFLDTPLQELGDIAESFAPGFASNSVIRRKRTAIEVVRQKEQVQQFKDRLANAKTTLIMTQNLSSSRVQNRQYQEMSRKFEQLLNPQSRHGRFVVSCQDDDAQVVTQTSSEIRSLCSSWSLPQLQPVLVSPMERASKDTYNLGELDSGEDSRLATLYSSTDNVVICGRRDQVGSTRFSVTRTFLGEVRCSTKMFKVVQPWSNDDEEVDDCVAGNCEREISFRYKPSRYIAKLGLILKDSLIFGFCRNGNVVAVRTLVRKRLAFIDDINEFDETPLHLRVMFKPRSALFSSVEAPIKIFTEVLHLCVPANQGKPGDICSINKSFHCRVSRQKVTSTLRQFLQGNDLEDVDWNGMGLLSLLKFDAKFDYYLRKSPSDLPFQWILDNVLPVTTSHLHSDVWWDMCITKVLSYRQNV